MSDNSNKTNDDISFGNLITRYKIEIPIIQRDYAQGRENPQANEVRQNIIKKICEAICPAEEETHLSFDFVYGKIKNSTFIPIDGQQRLTTLFLLHLYLFKRCDEGKKCDQCNNIDILNKFTYETRKSSREFCSKIVNENILPADRDSTIRKFILDQHWFFADWGYDPTIDGMLRTLDAIHDEFKGNEAADITRIVTRLLSQDCPITFHFLNMGDHNLSDDLYLKMNARGLPLTNFDNFKAKFEKFLKANRLLIAELNGHFSLQPHQPDENWEKKTIHEKVAWKLDCDWLNAFWKIKNEKSEHVMMQVFARFFYHSWLLLPANNKSAVIGDALNNLAAGSSDFLSFEHFDKVLEYYKSTNELTKFLKQLFTFMEVISKYYNITSDSVDKTIEDEDDRQWLLDAITPAWSCGTKDKEAVLLTGHKPKEQVIFFAISHYSFVEPLNEQSFKDLNKQSFKQWMRVVWNIVENGMTEMISAIKLANKLSEDSQIIYQYLAYECSLVDFDSSKIQIQEEIKKAKLIKPSPSEFDEKWESALIVAESHPLFSGSINFLLNDDKDVDLFIQRRNIASSLFNKNGDNIGKDDSLLIRAILSNCEPIELGWQESICLADNTSNWKKLLSRKDDISAGLVSIITRLSKSNLSEYSIILQDCCNNYLNDCWMSQIIKYKNLLSYSHYRNVQNYYDRGCFLFFNKKNYNEQRDILLGLTGDFRNKIINKLLDDAEINLSLQYPACKHEFEDSLDNTTVFFTGHYIALINGTKRRLWFGHTEVICKIEEDEKWSLNYNDFIKANDGVDLFYQTLYQKIRFFDLLEEKIANDGNILSVVCGEDDKDGFWLGYRFVDNISEEDRKQKTERIRDLLKDGNFKFDEGYIAWYTPEHFTHPTRFGDNNKIIFDLSQSIETLECFIMDLVNEENAKRQIILKAINLDKLPGTSTI